MAAAAVGEFDATCLLDAVRPETRKAVRFPMGSLLRVRRLGAAGSEPAIVGKGLNLSATGLAFLLPEPLALSTQVRVELPYSRLIALATVRNCGRRGPSWRVGVELVGSFEKSSGSAQ